MTNTPPLDFPPAKAATIEDVARLAGVALSTASGAFTGKKRMSAQTRENILRVAQSLHFEPNPHAQRLSQQKAHNLVGLFTPYLDTGVTTQKIKRIQYLLGQHGYEVPVYTCGAQAGEASGTRQQTLLKAITRQKPEALLCFTSSLHEDAVAELARYQAGGGVLVCFDHLLPLQCDHALFDRDDNGYQSARHLVELGHRNIGGYQHGPVTNPSTRDRMQGFARALREAGQVPENAWIFTGNALDTEYEECGAKMAHAFLDTPATVRPTALCGMPDLMATVFVHVVTRHEVRVPQDVSVVATDDTPLGRYGAVPLTTTTHPVEEIAQTVVALLSARLSDGALSPQHRTIRGELVVRASTAPPGVPGGNA